jgi:hypothetical protein
MWFSNCKIRTMKIAQHIKTVRRTQSIPIIHINIYNNVYIYIYLYLYTILGVYIPIYNVKTNMIYIYYIMAIITIYIPYLWCLYATFRYYHSIYNPLNIYHHSTVYIQGFTEVAALPCSVAPSRRLRNGRRASVGFLKVLVNWKGNLHTFNTTRVFCLILVYYMCKYIYMY